MSQNDILLAALLRGERLSKLDAFRMGAGLSINSRIADLRKQGYHPVRSRGSQRKADICLLHGKPGAVDFA